MKLVSPLYSFELSILGYGQNNTNWRDRNNLRCEIATFWKKQGDRQSAPLQTYDLSRLLVSLEQLRLKRTAHVTCTLSDQDLSVDIYALTGDKYKFQIQLNRSLTPNWHPYPDFPLEMDMVLNETQFNDLISDLSNQLAVYPER